MEDPAPDEQEPTPPLPTGTYNFDFDELDENINPFTGGSKLGQSPPHNISTNGSNNNKGEEFPDAATDPFRTKSSLKRSPTASPTFSDNIDDIDPFQPKTRISRSPTPGEGDVRTEHGDQEEAVPMEETGAGVEAEVPKKKVTSPKKNIKRPKTRPKFKPPEGLKKQGDDDDDDVQIFAPPPKQQAQMTPPEGSTVSETPEQVLAPQPDTVPIQTVPDSMTEQNMPELVPKSPDTVPIQTVPDSMTEQNTPESVPKPPVPAPAQSVGHPSEAQGPDSVCDEQNGAVFEDACENLSGPETPPVSSELTNSVKIDSHMTDSLEPFNDFEVGAMPEDEANEGFVPASDVFNDPSAWAMLEKLSGDAESDLARESLYVKFDPLIDREKTADPNTSQGRDTTEDSKEGTENDLLLMNTPPPAKSIGRAQKHPAVRALKDQVEGGGTPQEAREVDKMLAFTPGKGDKKTEGVGPDSSAQSRLMGSPKDNIVHLVQVLKYSQSDWNKMKQDLELDFQARMLNKEKEWSKKLADRDKKVDNLDDQVKVLKQSNEDMRLVVTEFEKTIAQLQAEKEKTSHSSKDSLVETERERDQAIEDLQSVESAFSDLHRRYEKTKGVVEGFKKNEEVLKKCVQDYQTKLQKAEELMQSIKEQAEDKLEQASQEMEKVRRSTSSDVARLEAALRKTELQVNGLQRGFETKTKENEELTAICDELIAKVGS